jgi:hypothetical protein
MDGGINGLLTIIYLETYTTAQDRRLFVLPFSFCHVAPLPSDEHQLEATAVANAVDGEQEAANHPNKPKTQPCSQSWTFSKISHHPGASASHNSTETTRPKSAG